MRKSERKQAKDEQKVSEREREKGPHPPTLNLYRSDLKVDPDSCDEARLERVLRTVTRRQQRVSDKIPARGEARKRLHEVVACVCPWRQRGRGRRGETSVAHLAESHEQACLADRAVAQQEDLDQRVVCWCTLMQASSQSSRSGADGRQAICGTVRLRLDVWREGRSAGWAHSGRLRGKPRPPQQLTSGPAAPTTATTADHSCHKMRPSSQRRPTCRVRRFDAAVAGKAVFAGGVFGSTHFIT